jgi:hypothetical protein
MPGARPLETITPSAVPDILAPGLAVVLTSIPHVPTRIPSLAGKLRIEEVS